ncbi:MAG: site-specific integrase, partial [Oscillospiraceae bacterium]
MSVTKDGNTGKWMAQVRVTDWQGKVIHKKKRGFKTKKEASGWEAEIVKQASADVGMLFRDFIELYFEDMSHRLKQSTLENKHWMVDIKITPIFGNMPLSEITANDVRKWQNGLTSYRDDKGKGYSQTYLKTINNQLTAIFNYAVKYYNLKENPCHKAGSMGKKDADEMKFWTKAEFDTFIETTRENPLTYTAFMTLYYTGMRIGELTALTKADIDLAKGTITINKSYQRLGGKDIITTPKTPKSNRIVTIPKLLISCISEYFDMQYSIRDTDRIFTVTKSFMAREIQRGCAKCGVKRIRVHDTRHSHASLLIELGFSPLLIADRLGHEK